MNARRLVVCAFVFAILSPSAPARVMPFESHRAEPQNLSSDSPEENQAPRAAVMIRGQKDPRMELWFIAAYSTTNDACRTRSFGQAVWGAPMIAQTVYDSVRVPPGETNYSVQFFLDKYSPARCGWTAIAILRAAFLPDEANGPGGMSGLLAVRDNGADHISVSFLCTRRTYDYAEPHFYLECLTDAPSWPGDLLSKGGGVIEVEMLLVPGPPVPLVPGIPPKVLEPKPSLEHG
ncbi:hypothetical protein [Trinickia acidisoli]|uniref:hypothetical protein n=1 Tax=Trinickia acidisoli TaxID=2767482 RepID=UPI001A908668|nr:hypothetical protein [Trinickia acidisoli]